MNYRGSYRQGYRVTNGYRIGAYGDGTSTLVPPPENPQFWIDPLSFDGNLNSTLADGGGVGTLVNLGSFGTSANETQGTGSAQPLFRTVAAAGKLNGSSALEGDGNRWLPTSAAIASQASPFTVATIFKVNDTAAAYYLWTGRVEGTQHELIVNQGGAGKVQLNNGGAFVDTGQTVTAGSWNMSVAVHNGASSVHRLNGVASATLNLGSVAFTGIVIMGPQATASFRWKGMMVFRACWVGFAPDVTGIENYLTSRFGSFPQ